MASQGGLDSPVEPGIQSLVLESLLDLRYGGVRHPDADYATILGRHCLPLFSAGQHWNISPNAEAK